MKQPIIKLFIYVLILTTLYQGAFADTQNTGGGSVALDGLSSDDTSMVLTSPTQRIMGHLSVNRGVATKTGSTTDADMAKWFNDKVVGTPLADKGEDAVRYCGWEYDHTETVRNIWSIRGKWIGNCIRSSVAVGQQEQSLCTREPGISTKNCYSLHRAGNKQSYVRWDGKSVHKGREIIRVYAKYDDSLRDFIHLQAKYYPKKIMQSQVAGMHYAADPHWNTRVAKFYNQ